MNTLDRYLKQIRKHMVCSSKMKTKLLREYRETITYNQLEGMTLSELYQRFDEPHIVAENLMGLLSERDIKKTRAKRISVILIICAFVFSIALLIGVAVLNGQDRSVLEEEAVKDNTTFFTQK